MGQGEIHEKSARGLHEVKTMTKKIRTMRLTVSEGDFCKTSHLVCHENFLN